MPLSVQLYFMSGAIAIIFLLVTWDDENPLLNQRPVEHTVLWTFVLNPLYWAIALYVFLYCLFTLGDDD